MFNSVTGVALGYVDSSDGFTFYPLGSGSAVVSVSISANVDTAQCSASTWSDAALAALAASGFDVSPYPFRYVGA